MKILHAAMTRSDRASGDSVYVLGLLKALVADGSLQVGLLPSVAGVDPHGASAIPGCTLLAPPPKPHLNPWLISAAWLDRIEKAFGRPDLVHFHSVYDPFHTSLARRMRAKGWKYVVSPHGALQERAQANKRLKKSFGNLLFFDDYIRHAAAVIATSPIERAFVEKRYKGVRTLIHLNAVSEDHLEKAARLPPPPPRDGRPFVVGYIGRLDIFHKGLDTLMRAIEDLERYEPSLDVRFVIVGPYHTPGDQETLTALRATLKRAERVRLIGPLHGDAKLEALSGFDVFIHTSRHEGMPAAVIEAMAASKPCILTPGTNLQFVIDETAGGWACADSPASVASAVREAAQAAPAELARRGRAVRRFVEERMTWPILARDYARDIRAIIR